MRVAILHYHLRPCGVSRVILNHLQALRGKAQTLVITGEAPACPLPGAQAVIPSLAYQGERAERTPPRATACAIALAARQAWDRGADLYHFHNPTLGKNRDLLSVIGCLQDQSARVLLQIHDLAEDGRPEGYIPAEYPADCHYAVINRRDRRILLAAGLTEPGLHFLPNPVLPLSVPSAPSVKRRLVLYPVRAVRRKNLGEALLLSLFLPDGLSLGITQVPTGELDLESYLGWRELAREHHLRVAFHLAAARSIRELVGEARCALTTSVKESFGMAFLEPWTAGKLLQGRLLPDICTDFTAEGVRLDHLYRGIRIPLRCIEVELFRRKWLRCYRQRLRRYGLPAEPDRGRRYLERLLNEGDVDFGLLSEDLQRQALLQAVRSARARNELLERNPFLESLFAAPETEELVAANRAAVLSAYSVESFGTRLLEAYETVLRTAVRQSIDKATLAAAFNTPERILLLQCAGAYA